MARPRGTRSKRRSCKASSSWSSATRYLFGDDLARQWWTTATLKENEYLLPDPALAPAREAEYRDPSSANLLQDVRACVDLARRHDLELLVLDQTRPDIGLSVVKVV